MQMVNRGSLGSRRPRRRPRSFLALVIAGAIAIVAAGCGSSGASKSGSATAAANSGGSTGTLTISDWEFSENGVGPHMEAVLKAYEQTHPGVHIKFQTMSYDTYAPTIQTQIGAQGGPDLMVLVDSTYAQLQAAGDLAAITSLTPSEVSSLRPQNATADAGGKRTGVIWETVIYDFLYNKSLLSKAGISTAPTNFTSFLADCKAIKAKTGKWGYAARNMLNETESWYEDFTGTWIDGFGGSWFNSSGKWTIDNPNNVAAVTDYDTVYHSGCMDTGVPASVFRASYENGDVGMMMDNSDAGYTYTYQNSKLTNTMQGGGPLPFPAKTSGDQQLYLAINKYSSHTALAENFLRWLMEPAQQHALIAATAPQTTATTVLPSKGFTASHRWAEPFYSQVANGESELVPQRPAITARFEDFIMPYIAQVLSGQLTPKAALTQAQQAAVSRFGDG